jgi:hypothetical protein
MYDVTDVEFVATVQLTEILEFISEAEVMKHDESVQLGTSLNPSANLGARLISRIRH